MTASDIEIAGATYPAVPIVQMVDPNGNTVKFYSVDAISQITYGELT